MTENGAQRCQNSGHFSLVCKLSHLDRPTSPDQTSSVELRRLRMKLKNACSALVIVLCVSTALSAQAQTLSVLYTFTGGADGGSPVGGLIRDAEGNLYGTTCCD